MRRTHAMTSRVVAAALWAAVAASPSLAAQTPQQTATPPVPRPFPQPAGLPPAAPAKPAETSATAPQTPGTSGAPANRSSKPTEADLGVQFYPGSDFLDSYDAGRGQRYYLFGTNDSYADVVAFYRRVRGGGTELFKAPPMQKFDLDVKYREDTMAFPPSVVVKDYTWNNSEGYLFVSGTFEKRYKTIIQIVPAPAR